MTDIQKQLEYFKGLAYEVKREKVLEMLKKLEWTHETFAMFYKTITTLTKVSENVLLYIYQSIFEIANELEAGNKAQAEDKIKSMAEVIMAIKKEEELERKREGDPDDLLKKL